MSVRRNSDKMRVAFLGLFDSLFEIIISHVIPVPANSQIEFCWKVLKSLSTLSLISRVHVIGFPLGLFRLSASPDSANSILMLFHYLYVDQSRRMQRPGRLLVQESLVSKGVGSIRFHPIGALANARKSFSQRIFHPFFSNSWNDGLVMILFYSSEPFWSSRDY